MLQKSDTVMELSLTCLLYTVLMGSWSIIVISCPVSFFLGAGKLYFSFSMYGSIHIVCMYYLQQITQHQERFVQMLNEPRGGDTGGEGAEAQGSPHTNYIQVTPQEKEAIERVSYQCLY